MDKDSKKKIITLLVSILAICVLMCVSVALAVCSKNGAGYFSSGDGNAVYEKPPYEPIELSGELVAVWVPYMCEEGITKEKIDKIVADCKSVGANTIIFHVRSFGDSMYPSDYFPWSHLITGEQGRAPDFDPLEYMVNAAHASGMRLEAWVNPFRVRANGGVKPKKLSADNPAAVWLSDSDLSNDSFAIRYNGGIYYNPGEAQVRDLIIDGVIEIVSKYNVDGIHLDDYFYPANDESFDDSASYQRYIAGGGSKTLLEWRTENVNTLIRGCYAAIKAVDERRSFGISPAGNIENCLKMGADVYKWCSNTGYIDYICPQIYWSFEHKTKPFAQTCEEWRELVSCEDVSFYVGLALYKAGSDSDNGQWLASDNIIAEQIEYLRETDSAGYFIYSYEYLDAEQTKNEVANMLRAIADKA